MQAWRTVSWLQKEPWLCFRRYRFPQSLLHLWSSKACVTRYTRWVQTVNLSAHFGIGVGGGGVCFYFHEAAGRPWGREQWRARLPEKPGSWTRCLSTQCLFKSVVMAKSWQAFRSLAASVKFKDRKSLLSFVQVQWNLLPCLPADIA